MSSITIRNLDPAVKERLRIRATQHGRSMEAEARSILQSSLKEPEQLPARRRARLFGVVHLGYLDAHDALVQDTGNQMRE